MTAIAAICAAAAGLAVLSGTWGAIADSELLMRACGLSMAVTVSAFLLFVLLSVAEA